MSDIKRTAIIDIETGDSEKTIKELKSQVDQLNGSLEDTPSAAKGAEKSLDSLANTSKEIEQLNDSTERMLTGVENVARGAAGLVGAFEVVAGALQAAGIQSEDFEKVLVRMQGVMAMTQGFQAVAEGAVAFKNLYNMIKVATVGLNGFKLALVKTGIGAFVVLLGTAIGYMATLGEETKKTSEEIDSLNDSLRKNTASAVVDVTVKINKLSSEWAGLGDDMQAKQKFLDEKLNPAVKENGVQFNNVYEAEKALIDNKDKFIQALTARAKAIAASQLAVEAYKKAYEQQLVQEELKAKGEDTELVRHRTGYVQSNSPTGGMVPTYEYRRENTEEMQEAIDLMDEAFAVGDRLMKQSGELEQQASNTLNTISNGLGEVAGEAVKTAEEMAEEAAKLSEEQRKAYIEDQEAYITLLRAKAGAQADYNLAIYQQEIELLDFKMSLYDKDSAAYMDLLARKIELQREFRENNANIIHEVVTDEDEGNKTVIKNRQASTTEADAWAAAQFDKNGKLKQKQNDQEIKGDKNNTTGKINNLRDYFDAYVAVSNGISNILKMSAANAKEGSKKQKALEIAAATLDTIAGGVSTFFSVMNSIPFFPANVITAGVISGASLGFGFAQIAKMKAVDPEGNGGGEGAEAGPQIPAIDMSALEDARNTGPDMIDTGASIESAIKDSRVVVTESDITDTEKRVKVAESEASF